MDRKLKTWELALMLGVLMAVVAGGWLGQEQRELADSVIRFHVIANSDSEADQALKLAVRDRVLEEAQDLYPEDATLEEAQAALEGHLNTLAAAGRTVVEDEGYDYPVTAQLTDCWFPTKEYAGCALPAGSYTALRVTIGAWGRPARRWTRPWRRGTSPRSRGRWSPARTRATSSNSRPWSGWASSRNFFE